MRPKPSTDSISGNALEGPSQTPTLWSRVVATARAVADAEPDAIESAARSFGESRRWLAPLAWAAGALVLLVRGIKLLLLNWRLTLIELVPAAWIWLIMYDLKQHALRGAAFRHFSVLAIVVIAVVAIAASIASFWCNTVFAFAISNPHPKIRPAVRQARPHMRQIVAAGTALGVLLVISAFVLPRIGPTWLFVIAIGAVYAVTLISFVAVPARIIGLKKQKLPPREAVGRMTVGGALSAVAMTPGFLLDRVGLLIIGIPGLHILGFVLLSIGTALYAAGMSSVRAVKLSMKLDTPS